MILEIHFNHTNKTERIEINKSKCILGRSPKADFQIDLGCFSRNHLAIELIDNEIMITDLNSTNGVYVNGDKIPQAVPVIFQNFFPIEIGGEVSIYVFSSETSQAQPIEASRQTYESSEQTRTIFRPRAAVVARASVNKKVTTEKKKNTKYFFISFIMLGALYYFYQIQGENVQSTPEQTVAESAGPSKSFEPNLELNSNELKQLMNSNECLKMGDFCVTLKLTHSQEMVSFSSDRLLLYVNYPLHVVELSSAFLEAQQDASRAEYVLASFAFHPKVIQEAEKRNIKYVVVIGMDPLDDIVRLKYSSVLELKNGPKFSQDDFNGFFSNIFYAGVYRPYKKELRPFLKFNSL
jgi:pSer/pThr/pTyr-binding forkhead associated (FHA) protein